MVYLGNDFIQCSVEQKIDLIARCVSILGVDFPKRKIQDYGEQSLSVIRPENSPRSLKK